MEHRRTAIVCSRVICFFFLVLFHGPVFGSVEALGLLETHCVRCHGGEKTKAGLDLTTREALMRGGESGSSVIPGKPTDSLLIQMVRHEAEPAMPYKERKLSSEEISVLEMWVKDGVPFSRLVRTTLPKEREAKFVISEKEKQHWAFQPLKAPPVPNDSKNPIDAFLLERLEEKGLSFAPKATREQLIRRVYFDLVGLPPSPAEIDTFLRDTSPTAFNTLVERLLASKHYGERWARHWLDLARYAETDGFEHDAVRPHSWRYRDYVIDSFNSDKPYDQFILEQIAGDELFPDNPSALVATGFNLLGPDMVDSSDQLQRRHNSLNDMTDTVGLAFLGMTIGCARCHDHKQEPISQKDYYSLQAFFNSAKFERERPIPTPSQLSEYNAGMKKLAEHPKTLELAEMEKTIRAKIFEEKVARLSPEAQMAHRTPVEERNAQQANLVLETSDKVALTEKDLEKNFAEPDRENWKRLSAEVKKLPRPAPLPKAMALAKGPAAPAHVLFRGDYNQPGDRVEAGFPEVLAATKPDSSRVALAKWLASKENPLTARVMVNRIWKHHFGRGLVATPSDFGLRGAVPTHPELLDWLAVEFISSGWSIKQMHRLILGSRAYQQSTRSLTALADPDNRLFGRMNRIRLEGEVIRDALLEIGGNLNKKMGGPGVMPPIPKELFAGATGWNASNKPEEYNRRSIYIFARRNLRFPFLEVFDAPDNNLSCAARECSTTAPQALTLLNAEEVIHAAKAASERIKNASASLEGQISFAFRLTLGRTPSAEEQQLAQAFLEKSPMEEFCRALFNLNEFIYLE